MWYIPEELRNMPHWCTHENKRPSVDPDKAHLGKVLNEIQNNPQAESNYGMLLSADPDNDIIFIDVDCPNKEAKVEIVEWLAKDPTRWQSDEHYALLERTLFPLPEPISELIGRTYTEFSPSGAGLHIIGRCQEKHRFTKAYKKASSFSGQIDFRNVFLTFTNKRYKGSPLSLGLIPLDEVKDTFGMIRPDTKVESGLTIPLDEPALSLDIGALPNVKLMLKALDALPMDQNKRIKTVFKQVTGQEYEHYTYWLTVGMALHRYGLETDTIMRMFVGFLEWSRKDELKFTSDNDVRDKWISFSDVAMTDEISWRTIIKLYNLMEFDWPRPMLDKNKNKTGNPQTNEYVNFEYLLNFYNIQIYEDDGYYITGDKEICEKYFLAQGTKCWFDKYYGPHTKDTLMGSTLMLCQDSKWRGLVTTSTHVSTWLSRPRDEMDLFQTWLDTPFNELPDELKYVHTKTGKVLATNFDKNSTIKYIIDNMSLDYEMPEELAVARLMVEKTFFQMIKFRECIETPFTDNGGMLILIGSENTFKSTFFKMLLPRPLDFLRKEINLQIKGDKGTRDFVRSLGKKSIVQIDEFEGMMDHMTQGSLFKAIISGDSASITDIYQTKETIAKRKAIIVGTSNETRHTLSENGSRRMWLVKVGKINTDALLHINLHKLYNDLRIEFRSRMAQGESPWLLKQENINRLYMMNEQMTSRNEVSLILREIFPFDGVITDEELKEVSSVQAPSDILYSTREVMQVMAWEKFDLRHVKLPALERALERYCSEYTGTMQGQRLLVRPKAIILKGQLCQGRTSTGAHKYHKWVLPKRAVTKPAEEKKDV